MIFVALLATGFVFTFCQHDNEEIIPVKGPDPIVRGIETLTCTDCTPLVANGASADFNAGNIPSGQWYCDKTHSNVTWETPYKGVGSLLTGRFNYFVLKQLSIDEANPANISFEGYVRLNSVNTGEPGRDGGCLLTTYGTAAGKTVEPENNATLKSTSVQYSTTDEGYIAKADLTFYGFTKEVTGKLYYVKQSDDGAGKLAGVSMEFSFLAKTDFTISSTNIADKITVKINATMKAKP
jgi:polyisoprenoid-binding protein YceI